MFVPTEVLTPRFRPLDICMNPNLYHQMRIFSNRDRDSTGIRSQALPLRGKDLLHGMRSVRCTKHAQTKSSSHMDADTALEQPQYGRVVRNHRVPPPSAPRILSPAHDLGQLNLSSHAHAELALVSAPGAVGLQSMKVESIPDQWS